MNRGSSIGADASFHGGDTTPRTRESSRAGGMVMDTSTVRLVIFLGMFLMLAGDYTYLITAIFGRSGGQNITEPSKGGENQGRSNDPEGRTALSVTKKMDEKENGKG